MQKVQIKLDAQGRPVTDAPTAPPSARIVLDAQGRIVTSAPPTNTERATDAIRTLPGGAGRSFPEGDAVSSGGALGGALGVASMAPLMSTGIPEVMALARILPLITTAGGGFAGGVSAGQSPQKAIGSGIDQGWLQLLAGDAPPNLAKLLAPLERKAAFWLNTRALAPHLPANVLKEGIKNPATGEPFPLERDAQEFLGQRALTERFGRVGDPKSAVRANDRITGARQQIDADLAAADAQGRQVDPLAALKPVPALLHDVGHSQTEAQPSRATIIDKVRNYVRNISHPVTRTIPQPPVQQGTSWTSPTLGGIMGPTTSQTVQPPPKRVTFMQPRSSMPPTEMKDMLRRSGAELDPKWLKDETQPATEVRKALYGGSANELERVVPEIAGNNTYVNQTIPLADGLGSAAKIRGGDAALAPSLRSKGVQALGVVMRPGSHAAQSLFNASEATQSMRPDDRLVGSNLMRLISFLRPH